MAEGWQKTEDVARLEVHLFTGSCGPTEILPPNTAANDFLMQLLGDDFFSSVVHATNYNAEHYSDLRVAKMALGVRKEFLVKCCNLPQEVAKSDALNESTVYKVKDFYVRT